MLAGGRWPLARAFVFGATKYGVPTKVRLQVIPGDSNHPIRWLHPGLPRSALTIEPSDGFP
jgi:hypothetical protein